MDTYEVRMRRTEDVTLHIRADRETDARAMALGYVTGYLASLPGGTDRTVGDWEQRGFRKMNERELTAEPDPPLYSPEAAKVRGEVAQLNGVLDAIQNDDDKHRIGNEINGKVRRLVDQVNHLQHPEQEEHRVLVDELSLRVLVDIFDFSPEEAAAIIKPGEPNSADL